MTRGQREKLSEIMGFLWSKSDDALCATYAVAINKMLTDDEKEHWLPEPKSVLQFKNDSAYKIF